MTYVCCGIHSDGHQSCCEEDNVTAVCNRDGYWEPSTDDICAKPTDQSGKSIAIFQRHPYRRVLPYSIVMNDDTYFNQDTMHGPSYIDKCIKLPLK